MCNKTSCIVFETCGCEHDFCLMVNNVATEQVLTTKNCKTYTNETFCVPSQCLINSALCL